MGKEEGQTASGAEPPARRFPTPVTTRYACPAVPCAVVMVCVWGGGGLSIRGTVFLRLVVQVVL